MNFIRKIVSSFWRRAVAVHAEQMESEQRFRQLTDTIEEIFFLVNTDMTKTYYISPRYLDIWGRSCESLYADPRSFLDAIHPDDRDRVLQAVAPHGTVVPFDIEYRVVRPDGTLRWVRARSYPIRNGDGVIDRFAGLAEDITERKLTLDLITRQSKALEEGNRRLSLLGEMTGLLQTVTRVEEAASVINGYLASLCVGKGGALYLYKESRNYLDQLARWGPHTLPDSVTPDECWAVRRGQPYHPQSTQPALQCKHTHRVKSPCSHLCLPMMVEGGSLGLIHVVLEESPVNSEANILFAKRLSEHLGLALANLKLRETLRYEAMQDPLTQLYNRRFLEISLKREFARAEREDSRVAVVMLDVDHFKRFNDEHGHEAGDQALRQIGRLLLEACRTDDLACRYGGEEFAVVIPHATRDMTLNWAERMMKRVRTMKIITGGMILPPLTVSIGVAVYPEDGRETTEVIQAADQALYAAKRAGRDRCMSSELHEITTEPADSE